MSFQYRLPPWQRAWVWGVLATIGGILPFVLTADPARCASRQDGDTR